MHTFFFGLRKHVMILIIKVFQVVFYYYNISLYIIYVKAYQNDIALQFFFLWLISIQGSNHIFPL